MLLAEGLRLTHVFLPSAAAPVRGVSRQVPVEDFLPPETNVNNLEAPATAPISVGTAPDFVICCLSLDRLPECDVTPMLGFWFWQFGREPAGCVNHVGTEEMMDGSRVLASRLITWEHRAREGRVLQQGRFRMARHSLATTRRRVLTSCAGWPLRAWREFGTHPRRLALAEHWTAPPPVVRRGPFRKARLAAALTRGLFEKVVDELLREEKWTLGLLDRPIGSFLSNASLADAVWLKELPGRDYLADPMGLADEDRWILAEHFDAKRGKGDIAAVDLERAGSFTPAIDEPCHLSYPQLLTAERTLYCVPEQSAAGEVALYRAKQFPDRWEKDGTLLCGVAGADCTVFHHEGCWWMLGADHADQDAVKLFGWFAPVLQGPWQPHPLNPLKTDVCGARPAGPVFRSGGALYRPAQDCSRVYGGAIVIHRILELAPDRFREEPVARVTPEATSGYSEGVHTISAAGRRTVVDAKRHYLSIAKAGRTLTAYKRMRWPGRQAKRVMPGEQR